MFYGPCGSPPSRQFSGSIWIKNSDVTQLFFHPWTGDLKTSYWKITSNSGQTKDQASTPPPPSWAIQLCAFAINAELEWGDNGLEKGGAREVTSCNATILGFLYREIQEPDKGTTTQARSATISWAVVYQKIVGWKESKIAGSKSSFLGLCLCSWLFWVSLIGILCALE